MKFKTQLRIVAAVLFAALAVAALPSAWGQTFTTFDPSGSQSTSPVSINPAGQIVGNFLDSNFATHGFLRNTDGTMTPFDAPGAAFGTLPILITPQGSVLGIYFDAGFNMQIFQRAKDGVITTLQIPDPGASIYQVVGNSAGAIAGGLFDANGAQFFIHNPGGKFILIPIPPALIPSFFLPSITAMTPGGTILGSYFGADNAWHGFLRTVDGNISTFDAPNAATFFFGGTMPTSISDGGTVTGFYEDTTHDSDPRVFLRAPNGAFSSFDTPVLAAFGGAASINPSGAVAGDYFCGAANCLSGWMGFLRTTDGKVSPVNDPKAGAQGTRVTGINPAGEVIGFYFDENGVQHGYLRTH